ncbi:MAG: hypothetical protein K0U68_05830 [Gammaproteobacteria bacterium]|nr:hypothetical protein [Gammaproteobacteria bacterium]
MSSIQLQLFKIFGLVLLTISIPVHAVVVTTGCAGGMSCTLTELYNGGTILIGQDVLFNNWSQNIGGNSGNVNPNNIIVTGVDNGGSVGLSFVINPALSVVGLDDELELTFNFDASISTPSTRTITQATLDLTSQTIGGDAFVELNETLTPGGSMQVFVEPGDQVLSQSTLLADLMAIAIEGNVQMGSFENDSSATLAQFDYGFTIAGTPIPVPAAFPLFLSALIGLRLFGKKTGKVT